jgi:hypothetical protein
MYITLFGAGTDVNTYFLFICRVTTGKLVKDKSDKKSEKVDNPKSKKALTNTNGRSNTNNSSSSTPREGAPSTGGPTTQALAGMNGGAFGPMGLPNGGASPYGSYAMYHPQMGMHYMPPLGMQGSMAQMHNLQSMQHHQAQLAQQTQSQQQPQASLGQQSLQAPVHGGSMHSMLSSAPPMVHIYSGPMGYPMNTTAGRSFPMFPQAGAGPDMQQALQQQQQQLLATTQQSTASNGSGSAQPPGSSNSSSTGDNASTPHTPHTPHMMQQVYVGGMGPNGGIAQHMPVPMFGSTMFVPLMDPVAHPQQTAPAASSTGFSLLLPPGHAFGNGPLNSSGGAGTGASNAGAAAQTPSSSNSVYLAAAMSAAYADGSNITASNNGAAGATVPAMSVASTVESISNCGPGPDRGVKVEGQDRKGEQSNAHGFSGKDNSGQLAGSTGAAQSNNRHDTG